jgi:hypothetical protein
MPLYFLDVFNRTGCSRDEEGMELADLEAARAQAVDGIRSILQDEVAHGGIDFEGRVEVRDEGGNLLLTVTYRDAVSVRAERGG